MHTAQLEPADSVTRTSFMSLVRQLPNILKLRIGVSIAFAALAGYAVAPGPALAIWQIVVLACAVFLSSAAAAWAVLGNSLLLVAASFMPLFYG
ncbi:MAG TPA: hypothetical protein VN277_07495, partial [Acidiferrobacterales bacterium]|nr:hypothetical protein [Acidiferrobacterales bacterium]